MTIWSKGYERLRFFVLLMKCLNIGNCLFYGDHLTCRKKNHKNLNKWSPAPRFVRDQSWIMVCGASIDYIALSHSTTVSVGGQGQDSRLGLAVSSQFWPIESQSMVEANYELFLSAVCLINSSVDSSLCISVVHWLLLRFNTNISMQADKSFFTITSTVWHIPWNANLIKVNTKVTVNCQYSMLVSNVQFQNT